MSDAHAPLDEARAERLERYRAGRMRPEEREAFEHDVLADDALAEALYAAEALESLARRRRRALVPARGLALAAAFAAVFAAAWWWGAGRETPAPGPVRRGEDAAVRPLAPVGALAAPPERFAWTRDPAAAGYRFELRDAGGRPVATRVTSDTVITAADLGAALPAAGDWSVVPLAADGSERPAPPAVRFSVAAR